MSRVPSPCRSRRFCNGWTVLAWTVKKFAKATRTNWIKNTRIRFPFCWTFQYRSFAVEDGTKCFLSKSAVEGISFSLISFSAFHSRDPGYHLLEWNVDGKSTTVCLSSWIKRCIKYSIDWFSFWVWNVKDHPKMRSSFFQGRQIPENWQRHGVSNLQ